MINRDFADIKTIMEGMGYALMGTAEAAGENRAVEATNRAIASPLLEDGNINGAQGILLNITGSSKLTLFEVHEASSIVQKAAAENANIIFGAVLNESMGDAVKVTVIATGIKSERFGIKPLSGSSMAMRSAQQSVRSALAKKDKLPMEQERPEMTTEIPKDDFDVPAFLRRRKPETKE
jgi:cell division protein FtsZ